MDASEQFTRCWTQAQPIVASFIGSLVPDFHEGQDLLQEVAVVLSRKFSEYDQRRPFIAWALGVARFEILASRRRHACSRLTTDNELLESIALAHEELAPELERRKWLLRECLGLVQGRAAELLRLRYEEEIKPDGIAHRLGLGAVAVRVMLSRTRAVLRDCIERRLRAGETPP